MTEEFVLMVNQTVASNTQTNGKSSSNSNTYVVTTASGEKVTRTYNKATGSVSDVSSSGQKLSDTTLAKSGGYRETTTYSQQPQTQKVQQPITTTSKTTISPVDTSKQGLYLEVTDKGVSPTIYTQTKEQAPKGEFTRTQQYVSSEILGNVQSGKTNVVSSGVNVNKNYELNKLPSSQLVGGAISGSLVTPEKKVGFGEKIYNTYVQAPAQASMVLFGQGGGKALMSAQETSSGVNKNVFSESQLLESRQYLASNIKGTEFSFKDLSYTIAPLPSYVYGKISGDKYEANYLSTPKYVLEHATFGETYLFFPKQSKLQAKIELEQYYISKGDYPALAKQKAEAGFQSFKAGYRTEVIQDIAVGIGSNLLGGGLVSVSEKVLPKIVPSISEKALYYGSRSIGMGVAGAFELNMFDVSKSKFVTGEKITGTDVVVNSLIGGATATGAQIFMEQGARVFLPKILGGASAKNIPVIETPSVGVREKFLYATDPLEPVSDFLTPNLGRQVYTANTPRTFSFEFGGTSFSYSPEVSNPFSTSSYTRSSNVNTLPSTFVNPSTNVQTKTYTNTGVNTLVNINNNPLTNVQTSPLTFTNTLPTTFTQTETLPQTFVNVNTNPNVNPFTNVNPNINPFTNVFVGSLPLLPPASIGGGGISFGDFGFIRSNKKTRYTPSLSALIFNIRSKKKASELTGLNIRPIVM